MIPAQLGNVTFLRSDMLKLDLSRRFDLVVLPYYTFNHLSSEALRAQCLSVVAKHLAGGALAVIHAAAPARMSERRPERKQVFRLGNPERPEAPAPRLEVTWRPSNIVDEEQRLTQVVDYQLFAADGATAARSTEELNLWWFGDDELASSATRSGLELERTLTSFMSGEGHERIYILLKRNDAA
jgi:hypothetical protein